jgi:hypothetical protein
MSAWYSATVSCAVFFAMMILLRVGCKGPSDEAECLAVVPPMILTDVIV